MMANKPEHVPHLLSPYFHHQNGHCHVEELQHQDQGNLGPQPQQCLLWACKACKKRVVRVDRRHAATMRERKRLRKVSFFFKRKEIFEKNKSFFPLLLLYSSSTSNELGRTFSEGLAPAELHWKIIFYPGPNCFQISKEAECWKSFQMKYTIKSRSSLYDWAWARAQKTQFHVLQKAKV